MEGKLQAGLVAFLLLSAVGSAPHAFAQQGIITTIAGGGSNGGSARLADIGNTTTVAVDASGNIFFGSLNLHQVFELDFRGRFTLVAGKGTVGFSGDEGPATEAAMSDPMGIAVDRQGNLFISDIFNERVRRVDALTGIITTVAGNGKSSFSGDDGPATDARLESPGGLALDAGGNLFIAETGNERIRRVDAATGIITTVAGNGQGGFSGDGGPATSASLGPIHGLAVDAQGDVFLTDLISDRVRRVDAITGIITTVAGNGVEGYGGDGGPATSASFNWPYGVALDDKGNLFVGDENNKRVRRIDEATGIITTVAGNGQSAFRGEGEAATSASLNPVGVAMDRDGDIFIADPANHRVLRVDAKSGALATIVGGGNGGDSGRATDAILVAPAGIATDQYGNVFIAEPAVGRVRRVEAATGIITTVAGNGTRGLSGDGGPATSAGFFHPGALALGAQGDLFIADSFIGRIRRVDAETGIITTVAGGGRGGDGDLAVNARLQVPAGVAVDAQGNLFIADSIANRVRRVAADTGIITTMIGGGGDRDHIGNGGPATSAFLARPWRLAVDSRGDLFIAEAWGGRIRRVDRATGTVTTVSKDLHYPNDVAVDAQGNVFIAQGWIKDFAKCNCNRVVRVDAVTGTATTVVGDGSYGFGGDGGTATSASLGAPQGIALDVRGRLLIADTANNRVRAVELPPFAALSPAALSFSSQLLGKMSAAQAVTVTNTGLIPMVVSSVSLEGTNADDFAQTSSCESPLKPGANCMIYVTFTPTEAGMRTATLAITDNGFESPHSVVLSGTGASGTAGVPLGPPSQ
jgi:trimeric autotransporter adhesin